ncbi:MAG: histidine phosphatase family protein [Bacteroidia bacterium]|nr:histidine phosphatase family protein [Bacteroidia bacterium]
MKPKRIILIRHGESKGNVDKTIYKRIPDYALELTDKGLSQAKEAGNYLKQIVNKESLFFYVSPLWRTRSTFEQVVKSLSTKQFKYVEEPRIREQEWGHLRSLEESKLFETDRDAYGTFYFRIPDGESAADVYDRVSDFFGTMHRDFEKDNYAENTVIITHGMTIRLFLMRWFHWTVEQFELLANPGNCEIIVLEKDSDNKYKLKSDLRKYERPDHFFQRPIKLD